MLDGTLASMSSFTRNGYVLCKAQLEDLASEDLFPATNHFLESGGKLTKLAVEDGNPGSRGTLVAWNRLYLARARELRE